MPISYGIALAGAAITLSVNIGAFLVGWGVFRATLEALTKRVTSLEAETSTITALKVEVARISERQEFLIEQLRDLNASLRWMRAAADDTTLKRPRRTGRPAD